MPANTLKITLPPVAALLAYLLLTAQGVEQPIAATLAVTLLTACWWVTEALPIPVTSLLPFALFPLFGVLTHKQAATGLGSHVIILLMGGFMLAKGIERSGLHRRVALGMLQLTGSRGGRPLVFAFMGSAAFLSMWISNTATCLVLMPIALAVIHQLNDERMNTPLVLAIAYSCSLGGIATLVGTPPNLIFAAVFEEFAGQEFSFARWMSIGLPIVVLGLPVIGLWLTRSLPAGEAVDLPRNSSWSAAERRTLLVFGLVVLLWVFRQEPFGGWSALLGVTGVGDSTIAILGVLLMFMVPNGREQGERLLDWPTAVDIPWGMLLLFAGGITIAKAFQVSGTAQMLGESMSAVTSLPPFFLILCICLCITFLTELTSNVATTTLFMPIMAAAAVAADLPVELLMIPAAISASCAFMLPPATAPNAIAYGSGHASIAHMAREGLVLNIMLAVLISVVCYWRLV